MELKPCPFCGQTEYLCVWSEGIKEDRQYQVVCDASHDGGCGASSGWKDTITEAIEAWNRRRTMDDLISRAALLKECEECQKTDPRFEERGWANHFINDAGEPSTEWYCVEDMIENAPAVDAAPVRHGRWVADSDGLPVCSVCDEIAMQRLFCDTMHGELRYDVRLVKTPFCPNCGAKMDKEVTT